MKRNWSYLVLSALALSSAARIACAQEPTKPVQMQDSNDIPTDVVCHSKAAMRKVMDSGGSPRLITELIRADDCLLVSDEAIKDASTPTDNGKGPAKVTVQTSQGVTQLWGYHVLSMAPMAPQAHYQPNPPVPVCRTKASMVKWMAADVWKVGDEGKKPNQAVLDALIKGGKCRYLPEEAIETIGDATDSGYGPAPVTIRTNHGILGEWSFPVGGE
ncbi:hypothetical protein DWU98_00365 [Dyella monticola]|uniref:Uncharacterized protein n=1 Tax=Dyella monticola TaxID=1927958 RepID=A0A370X7R1_9GAMM|nr:hypothetical protein [Dyella monticola]RDS84469.1 hypothetical protein DWU98_00365 [Dyella monticola]